MIFLGKIGSKEGRFKDMASQAKMSTKSEIYIKKSLTKFNHTTKYLCCKVKVPK